MVDVTIPDRTVYGAATPSSILYNEAAGTLRWLGIAHADFIVTAYDDAAATDPVSSVRVPAVERDIETAANSTHNRVVTFNIGELGLSVGGSYLLRVQAVPSVDNPVLGATPATYWGAPGPVSGPIEITYTAPAFADVLPSAWYFDAVMYVYNNDIMPGIGADTFAPTDSLTRAMMVTILYRLAGEPSVSGLANPFTDVREGLWYTDAVIWALDEGVTNGVTATTFEPNRPVSRQELAAFIARDQEATDRVPAPILADFEWPDMESVAVWARGYVGTLTAQNLFRDVPGTNFEPQTNATRAVVAAVLYRWLTSIA
ncbi:MAG: S-layer homology domain-containing protein [Oscillospiraceae bacterium]|nr:S-layer homology domain-containing protein [Oscillospiraceae bacterium]